MKKIKNIYGPYLRKDGRKHVVIRYEDNSLRTVSYPKWLVEQKLGRKLDPEKETIDHIDGDFNNNDFKNLRIVDKSKHAIEDAKRVKWKELKCVWCGKEFLANPHNRFPRKKGPKRAGPFCGTRCRGQYGAAIQNGNCEKLPNNVEVKRRYYKPRKHGGIRFSDS